MMLAWLRSSLQAKLVLAIVVCAVLPLAAVGAWLTLSGMRSGEALLRTQLDSMVSRAAETARQKWTYRQSDVALLAGNTPMRGALGLPGADAPLPPFVRETFGGLTGISSVVVHDAKGRVRWTLAQDAGGRGSDDAGMADAPLPPALSIGSAVLDTDGRTIGTVEASVPLEGLTPARANDPGPGSQFVAYKDVRTGRWLAPTGLDASALENGRFEWNDHPWLVVRRTLHDPGITIAAAGELDPFITPFRDSARVGALALLLSAIVVIALTIAVTSRLTRSIGDLAAAADGVSRGELDRRVAITSDDEVGRVARAFNTMIENLRRTMQELSQREAVAAMGELAATLAHQVRSPATAIRLDVQRAHDRLVQGSTERALLARSLQQLDRLERAVTGSLKVARSTGAEFTRVNLRGPLGRAITAVRCDYAADVTIVESLDVTGGLLVLGDGPSLEQLFANVLTNAAQAAAVGSSAGRVEVAAWREQSGRAVVEIRDNGQGMAPEVLARAGEPMFSTKPEGTGLGLAIARRIAHAHGAVMTIHSRVQGGARVRLVFSVTEG
jgi:signal transduction histidine kinase